MCADWIRTSGDRVHSLYAQLTDANGNLNLPRGTSVTFSGQLVGDTISSIGGAAIIVRPDATFDDPNCGLVRYDLNANDTSVPGIYSCQWRLDPPNYALTQSFPEDSKMILIVLPKV